MQNDAGSPAEALTGERRFELLVNAISDYAIYLLDRHGRVTSWNTGAQRVKGYAAEEIIGQHYSRFYTEEDRARGLPEQALRAAAEHGYYETEGWRVRRDGTRFWTSALIDAVRDETGELIGFAKVTRDMTERRAAQQALRESEERVRQAREALAQAQKLEAIGRLTGGVAHDFNNMLTIIRGSAELLRKASLPDEKRARYLEAILTTADRATLLTRQLLAFARQQPLQPESFDAAARIRGLAQIVETSTGTSIRSILDFDPEPAMVHADPTQFETAIVNMVINARDAMPDGGVLRIGVRRVDGVPAVRGHAAVEGDFVAVTVQDTGTGIAPDVLGRIFEPFFTTKAVNKGTGLGLSQAYGFAKQSGGEIDVASAPGHGSSFTLYLPRTAAPASAAAGPDTAGAGRDADRKLSLLLVEDNITVGEFAHGVLGDLGHSVVWATDGSAALAELERRDGRFDVLFSDVVMPGISGLDLAREARRRWPQLRVVLASGYSHVLAASHGHEFELLEKPYSVDRLTAVLLRRGQPPGEAGGYGTQGMQGGVA